MRINMFRPSLLAPMLALAPLLASAQGTVDDYRRAESFQIGAQRKLITVADVKPQWIAKTSRFWYRQVGPKSTDFILVDPSANTSAPAFDHARLASALSLASKEQYQSSKLPFETFEFVDDAKAIKVHIRDSDWTCTLSNYECVKNADAKRENEFEELSPDGKWAAFVKNHNLCIRYVPTGAVSQMTSDGVQDFDYATNLPSLHAMVKGGSQDVNQGPVVFWSPDSSKLVTYRIDSRKAGRFTSLQYVPPDQLRPKAFTYVYPLPGEVLPL